MQDIKPHTHQYRADKIQELIPIIKKCLGDNLLALAASGSFARNEDRNYSDLELVAFVKNPLQKYWEIRKIEDGMLIVVIADTKSNYIKKYLDISDIWYASGGDKLFPIINAELITEINNYKPENMKEKCSEQIRNKWYDFQEISAKTLNSIQDGSGENLPFVFHEMIKSLVILLAYLNQSPLTTLGSYISQAKEFEIKPKGFDVLIDISVNGKYQNFSDIEKVVTEVFTDMEMIIEKRS